jgi:hypothetical protein
MHDAEDKKEPEEHRMALLFSRTEPTRGMAASRRTRDALAAVT